MDHFLYSMGTDFEQYLEPKELNTMGSVSQATRAGILASRFRAIALYIASNQETLISLPLRSHTSYSMKELHQVAEYLWEASKLSTEIMTLIRMEMQDSRAMKSVIDIRNLKLFLSTKPKDPLTTIKRIGYDMALIYNDDLLAYQSSIRFNSTIFEYLLDHGTDMFTSNYYYLDSNIRALAIKYNHALVEQSFTESYYDVDAAPDHIDGFSLCVPHQLKFITQKAIEFGDEIILRDYYAVYFQHPMVISRMPSNLFNLLGPYKG
jgi:hypothetical protein